MQAFQRLCRLTKNVFVAHGKAVRIIRKKAVLPPKIGIVWGGMFLSEKIQDSNFDCR